MNHIYVRKPRGYRCEAVGAQLQRLFRLVHIKGRQAGLERDCCGQVCPHDRGGRGRIKATSARASLAGIRPTWLRTTKNLYPRVVTTGVTTIANLLFSNAKGLILVCLCDTTLHGSCPRLPKALIESVHWPNTVYVVSPCSGVLFEGHNPTTG